jgi:hypothetical protein
MKVSLSAAAVAAVAAVTLLAPVAHAQSPLTGLVGRNCSGAVINAAQKGANVSMVLGANATTVQFTFKGWYGMPPESNPKAEPFSLTNNGFDTGHGHYELTAKGPGVLHADYTSSAGKFSGDLTCQ